MKFKALEKMLSFNHACKPDYESIWNACVGLLHCGTGLVQPVGCTYRIDSAVVCVFNYCVTYVCIRTQELIITTFMDYI